MHRFLTFFFLFITLCAFAEGPFKKVYKNETIVKVLHDIESHFSLQIMYRPQDLTNIPSISCNINTSDYQIALRQVLGKQLQFTIRKNIVIITTATQAPLIQNKQQSQTKIQKTKETQLQSSPLIETTQNTADYPYANKIQSNNSDDSIVNKIFTDTFNIQTENNNVNIVNNIFTDTLAITEDISSQEEVDTSNLLHNGTIVEIKAVTNTIENVATDTILNDSAQNIDNKQESKSIKKLHHHTFQPSLSLGYGDALKIQTDFRYVYYFHRHWGLGIGLNFSYDAQKIDSTYTLSWKQEGRIGVPLLITMCYQFSQKWGIHTVIGATTSFMIYSGQSNIGKNDRNVDVIPFVEVDAIHPITTHADILFGLYSDMSAIFVHPWTIGIHIGFSVGK